MDHSHMDHGGMGHGDMGHGGGGMDHGDMGMGHCKMNMLFTWDTTGLCIVFEGWQVKGTWSLIASLMGVILLTAGYELVRELSRRYETRVAAKSADPAARSSRAADQKSKTIRAIFYAVQVFYSFFIMLLFMTYNGWVMLAVAVGAFLGYSAFGQGPATKTVACH